MFRFLYKLSGIVRPGVRAIIANTKENFKKSYSSCALAGQTAERSFVLEFLVLLVQAKRTGKNNISRPFVTNPAQ